MVEAWLAAIVLAALLAVLFYRQVKEKKNDFSQMELLTEQFQNQLEETADAIIERIELHVDKLEGTIKTANQAVDRMNERAAELEAQLKQADECILRFQNELKTVPIASASKAEAERSLPAVQSSKLPRRHAPVTETSRRVCALLEQGNTIGDVARQTGLGRGAILMIQEMHKMKARD